MSWARNFVDGLLGLRPEPVSRLGDTASIPRAEEAETPDMKDVPPTSAAALLAKSLTDRETRDEWVRERKYTPYSVGTVYTNAVRDLRVSRHFSYGLYSCSATISTPFTLTKAEEKVVGSALEAFDKHLSDERERAALARLIAPAQSPKSRKAGAK